MDILFEQKNYYGEDNWEFEFKDLPEETIICKPNYCDSDLKFANYIIAVPKKFDLYPYSELEGTTYTGFYRIADWQFITIQDCLIVNKPDLQIVTEDEFVNEYLKDFFNNTFVSVKIHKDQRTAEYLLDNLESGQELDVLDRLIIQDCLEPELISIHKIVGISKAERLKTLHIGYRRYSQSGPSSPFIEESDIAMIKLEPDYFERNRIYSIEKNPSEYNNLLSKIYNHFK